MNQTSNLVQGQPAAQDAGAPKRYVPPTLNRTAAIPQEIAHLMPKMDDFYQMADRSFQWLEPHCLTNQTIEADLIYGPRGVYWKEYYAELCDNDGPVAQLMGKLRIALQHEFHLSWSCDNPKHTASMVSSALTEHAWQAGWHKLGHLDWIANLLAQAWNHRYGRQVEQAQKQYRADQADDRRQAAREEAAYNRRNRKKVRADRQATNRAQAREIAPIAGGFAAPAPIPQQAPVGQMPLC